MQNQAQRETAPSGLLAPGENKDTLSAGKANPEHQKQYDMFMANGFQVVHDERYSNNVAMAARKIKDINKAVDFIASTTLTVVSRIEDAARKQGVKLPGNVILNGANQLMGEVIWIYETASKNKLSDEQKAQAFSLCSSMYLDQAIKKGYLTKEDAQAAAAELAKTDEGKKVAVKMSQLKQPEGPMPQDSPEQAGAPVMPMGEGV